MIQLLGFGIVTFVLTFMLTGYSGRREGSRIVREQAEGDNV